MAPDAVKVAELPAQIDSELTKIVGNAFTVTEATDMFSQLFASAAITVYWLTDPVGVTTILELLSEVLHV